MASYQKPTQRTDDEIRELMNPDNVTYTFIGGIEQQQRNWNAQAGCFDGMTAADLEELSRILDAVQ